MRRRIEGWSRRRRRILFVVLVVGALLPLALSTAVHPLHEDEPGGEDIVAFELAGSVERTEEILATWRAEGVVDSAKAIQLFDLVYPLIYALALAGGCLAAANRWRAAGSDRGSKVCLTMAGAALAAAAFDYVENVGLAVSLWSDPRDPWPQIAFAAATVKFALIAVALAAALSGLVARPSGQVEAVGEAGGHRREAGTGAD